MSVRAEADALKGVSREVGRLVEGCRRVAQAAARVERHMSRDGADELVAPEPGELRHLCSAARELRPVWQAAVLSVAQYAAGAARPAAPADRPRVLIVDDSPDIRALLEHLVDAEFEVVTAGDGLHAVVAAHAARPSLVLMDISMPVLDGIDAARLLKASPPTCDIPLLAHTAWPQACHDVEAERLFVEVLRKPLAPGSIVALLRRYALA